ncbi:trimethylamine methyltransferase family protein, partial [Chloroflexota bacterium]
MSREGILVRNPYVRITDEHIQQIHQASLNILTDPGLISFNKAAADIFHSHGAGVSTIKSGDNPCWQINIPENLINRALSSAPKTIKLGARNPENALIMNGDEARVFFITGSE